MRRLVYIVFILALVLSCSHVPDQKHSNQANIENLREFQILKPIRINE